MRRLGRLLVVAGFGLLALCLVPGASAKLDGPCSASVAGRDLATASATDPAQAIVIQPGQSIDYSFSATSGVVSHAAMASIGPYELKLAESAADGKTSSAVGSFDVAQVSEVAGGVYAVKAHATLADGSTCTGEFLMRIDGDPLGSTVGMASAAAVVLAGGGVVAISVTTAAGVKSILATLSLAP